MIIVGIDPGKSGAIVALGENGYDGYVLIPMPLSGKEICPKGISAALHAITFEGDTHIFIEHAQAMPKNGSVAMFNYGCGFGYLIGVCAHAGYPFTLVKPRQWQKVMHQGADQSADPKDRSAQVVHRLFPNVTFKKTPRCTKDHDGMIDALLIAEYGRRALSLL